MVDVLTNDICKAGCLWRYVACHTIGIFCVLLQAGRRHKTFSGRLPIFEGEALVSPFHNLIPVLPAGGDVGAL